jgi:hypothetical protein
LVFAGAGLDPEFWLEGLVDCLVISGAAMTGMSVMPQTGHLPDLSA